MIKSIKRVHILIFSLVILFLILGAVAFIKQDKLIQYSKNSFLSQYFPEIDTNKSKANLYIEGNKLKINFVIDDTDRAMVSQFSGNLGVSENYLKGIELELDQNSIDQLRVLMPLEVNLDFSDKVVKFSHRSLSGLKSGQPKKDVKISTGSGEFNLRANNSNDFTVQIKDPEVILNYATSSGQLSLSKKINPVFPILGRVDTIRVDVSGKSVNGELRIKSAE